MTRHQQRTIRLAPDLTTIYQAEAASLGASVPALIAADITRYRRMADAAIPRLTDKQWGLLSHVCDGIEALDIGVSRIDDVPSPVRIAAEIMDWMRGGGSGTSPKWARDLYDQVGQWPPLTVAGVLMRLRADGAKAADEAIAAAEDAD